PPSTSTANTTPPEKAGWIRHLFGVVEYLRLGDDLGSSFPSRGRSRQRRFWLEG
ncbi:unnamed protein product, partial [Linum tenue]